MRHRVVICTKDRPDEVARVLAALFDQTRPPTGIDVVDSSAREDCREVVDKLRIEAPVPVRYLRSRPGLTVQRNLSLDALAGEADVVHFLDDDAVPEPTYLAALCRMFEQPGSADVVGVCGRITNLPRHNPTRLHRLLRIDSDRGGALLESGVNVLVFDGEQPSEVDWLSGCSMSYRTSALDGLRFDERRGGNGLGEDVDFSARLGSRGRLLWVPDARVEHRQSAINRESALRVKRKAVAHRWQLAQDRVAPVRRRWVLVAAVGESALHIVKALSRASRHEAYAAAAVVLGMFDLCRWDRKRHVTDASRTASPPLGRISGNWWEPAGEDELAPAPQLGMSVIVCTYRRPARLHACLTALRTEVTATDEIVVVVPAEDGESRKVVAAAVPDAIVAHVEPGRVATACAAGVLAASRPLVAFLDDDAIPMPGWVAALRAPFADLSVGAVGGPIRNFAGVRTSSSFFTQREVAWVDRLGRPHSRLHELPARRLRCPADFLAGSNMAVRRDLLDVAEFVLPGMAPGWEMLVAAQVSDRSRTIVYDSSIVVEHHPAPRDHLPRSDEVRDAFDVAFAMRYLAGRTGRALPRAFWTAVGSRRAPGLLLPVLVHDRSARSRWAPARRGRAAARRALGARRP